MDLLLIMGMAILTFATRYLPFALSRNLTLPTSWKPLFGYVSIAMLTAILTQTALIRDAQLQLSVDNFMLLAALATTFCAAIGMPRSLSFAAGLSVFLLLHQLN